MTHESRQLSLCPTSLALTCNRVLTADMPPPARSTRGARGMRRSRRRIGTPPSRQPDKPGFDTALQLITDVKARLPNRTYTRFMRLLQDYKGSGVPVASVAAQVASMFAADPDLIDRFRLFLPESERAQFAAACDEVAVTGERTCLEVAADQLQRATEEGRVIDLSNDDSDCIPKPADGSDNHAKRPRPSDATSRAGRKRAAAPTQIGSSEDVDSSDGETEFVSPHEAVARQLMKCKAQTLLRVCADLGLPPPKRGESAARTVAEALCYGDHGPPQQRSGTVSRLTQR